MNLKETQELIDNGFDRSVADEVVEGFDHLEKKRIADQQIGAWLSAALEDPSTCQSMKDDINEWFECTPQEEREWVGLTDEEIDALSENIEVDDLMIGESTWHIRFGHELQRVLKEKNT